MKSTAFRVRSYECDQYGHLNNAVFAEYLQQATAEALSAEDQAFAATDRQIEQLSIEYLVPVLPGEELLVKPWSEEPAAGQLTLGYAYVKGDDGSLAARARARWIIQGAEPGALPIEIGEQPRLKPFTPPPDNGARPFRWRFEVRHYEPEMAGRVAPAGYMRWVEHAVFRASALKGWTAARMQSENTLILVRRHEFEFLKPVYLEQEVEMVSRLLHVQRVRGAWLHELYEARSEICLMRGYTEGAFLDLQGRIHPAPAAMLEALRGGE